ncbi:MAG: pentapeptide repeat-containing protein [Saprospiraceae bacterium]|nr:pentapeptide repeat-containing protein [Saprospiraceae bacterium]
MNNRLVSRWSETNLASMNLKIYNYLYCGKDLHNIDGLEEYNGRLDLRGYKIINGFSKGINSLFILKKIKNSNFKKIDFSYSDFSNTIWENCTIESCNFEQSNFKSVDFTNIEFKKTKFRNCNLSESILNMNSGINSGKFEDVDFIDCNMSKSLFRFPLMKNCRFINCNLFETDFDGTRFEDCSFSGVLDSTFFRGYSFFAKSSIKFKLFYNEKFHNKMDNIDFSQAILKGVIFAHKINLNKCKFNITDTNLLIILDSENVFNMAKVIIRSEWQEPYKEKGIVFIDKVLYTDDHKEQKINIVDRYILTDDGKDQPFGDMLFDLLVKCNFQYKNLYTRA